MNKIGVILADDQKLFAESLKTVLEGHAKDIRVVAMAFDGQEACDLTAKHIPDIVLMDVRMPGMDGVEATRKIHGKFPNVKIVMLTTYDDDEYVHKALCYGAVGYILKNVPPKQLIISIRAVYGGSLLISPSVANKLVRQVYLTDEKMKDRAAEVNRLLSLFDSLSKREGEVLDFVLQAYSNEEIAEKLFIAEQTVKNHISTIYSKLGTNDRIHTIHKVKNFLSETSVE